MAKDLAHRRAEEARRAYQQKEYMTAARAFSEAAQMYSEVGDGLSSAEMHNNQAVALLQANQAHTALEVVADTDRVFARAGDTRRQAMALANQAAALDAIGHVEEAVSKYEQSALLLEQVGEDGMRADVMRSLSVLQVKHRKPVDAVVTMQSGLAGLKKPSLAQRILKKLLRFRLWL